MEKEKGVVIKKVILKDGKKIGDSLCLNLTLDEFSWSGAGVLATRFPKSLAEKFVSFLTYQYETLGSRGYTPARELAFSVELEPDKDAGPVVRAFELLPNNGAMFGLGEFSETIYDAQNKAGVRKHYAEQGLGVKYVRSARWVNQQKLGLYILPDKIAWNDSLNYRTLIPEDLAAELVDFLNEYVEEIRQYNISRGWKVYDSLKELRFFTADERN
jgi:hypothetical protein